MGRELKKMKMTADYNEKNTFITELEKDAIDALLRAANAAERIEYGANLDNRIAIKETAMSFGQYRECINILWAVAGKEVALAFQDKQQSLVESLTILLDIGVLGDNGNCKDENLENIRDVIEEIKTSD